MPDTLLRLMFLLLLVGVASGCAKIPVEQQTRRLALLERWAAALPADQVERCAAEFLAPRRERGWRRVGDLRPDPEMTRISRLRDLPPGMQPIVFAIDVSGPGKRDGAPVGASLLCIYAASDDTLGYLRLAFDGQPPPALVRAGEVAPVADPIAAHGAAGQTIGIMVGAGFW